MCTLHLMLLFMIEGYQSLWVFLYMLQNYLQWLVFLDFMDTIIFAEVKTELSCSVRGNFPIGKVKHLSLGKQVYCAPSTGEVLELRVLLRDAFSNQKQLCHFIGHFLYPISNPLCFSHLFCTIERYFSACKPCHGKKIASLSISHFFLFRRGCLS